MEYQADGIGTTLRHQSGIIHIGQATDFYTCSIGHFGI